MSSSQDDEEDPAPVLLSSLPNSETLRNIASDRTWSSLLPVSSHLQL